MNYTEHYNLNLPTLDEQYDIKNFNDNAKKIDETIFNTNKETNDKITNLIKGTTKVGKAINDENGKNIAETYATKTQLSDGSVTNVASGAKNTNGKILATINDTVAKARCAFLTPINEKYYDFDKLTNSGWYEYNWGNSSQYTHVPTDLLGKPSYGYVEVTSDGYSIFQKLVVQVGPIWIRYFNKNAVGAAWRRIVLDYNLSNGSVTKVGDNATIETSGNSDNSIVNKAKVSSMISGKADTKTVETALGKKANTSDVNTALSKKLDSSTATSTYFRKDHMSFDSSTGELTINLD